jgi:hypothetical protein
MTAFSTQLGVLVANSSLIHRKGIGTRDEIGTVLLPMPAHSHDV